MADFITRNTYSGGAEATTPPGRLNRQGGLVVVPQYLQWSLEGRVYLFSSGTETTPITAVAYDQDQPEFTLGVPLGRTVIPLSVRVHTETSTGTDKEMIIWRVTNAVTTGGAAATAGPTNLRSDAPNSSLSTGRQLHIANITLTDYIELWRETTPIASIAPFTYVWEPQFPAVLVGPATLGVQFAATTTQPTFYLKVIFAEFPTGEIT